MSVTEIETAITKATERRPCQLMIWLNDYNAKLWDKQIEADLDSGRLDTVLAEVEREYEAGLAEPL